MQISSLLQRYNTKGFILPFTMLIVTLILLVLTTGANTLSKQLLFSKIYRQSQAAYYAADDALQCTLLIEGTYTDPDSGLGIFPGGTPVSVGDPNGYINAVFQNFNSSIGSPMGTTPDAIKGVKCAQVSIFDSNAPTNFIVLSDNYVYTNPKTGLQEQGKTSEFTMKMPLGDGSYRCAKVTVHKTEKFRQIISEGYSSCIPGLDVVERAVVDTTIQ